MKRYKTKAEKRAYARNYYYEHREKLLNYVKSRYQCKGSGKCIVCGKDLSDMPTRAFRYCNDCINDKEKVSRQARWWRNNTERANALKRKASAKRRKK